MRHPVTKLREATRKLEAVKQVHERGVPSAQVARDLGIGANVVSRWVREASGEIRKAFPGQGQQSADQAEIERLKREIIKLKAEKDILKKAAAYFAKESS
jgi:transposase